MAIVPSGRQFGGALPHKGMQFLRGNWLKMLWLIGKTNTKEIWRRLIFVYCVLLNARICSTSSTVSSCGNVVACNCGGMGSTRPVLDHKQQKRVVTTPARGKDTTGPRKNPYGALEDLACSQ
jgi:hypothetical protein